MSGYAVSTVRQRHLQRAAKPSSESLRTSAASQGEGHIGNQCRVVASGDVYRDHNPYGEEEQ